MKKIIVFVGTRPEAIKMAPVVAALRATPTAFETRVCSSGQHRELLASALSEFGVTPDISLDVMTENQTLAGLSSRLFSSIDALLEVERPDAILVQGDTTTVAVAALCAFYRAIPVGHVESGLRSFDIRSPFPEEMNRRVATLASRWHFAPTEKARANLIAEGVPVEAIHVVGNTVIDALLLTVAKVRRQSPPLPPSLAAADLEGRAIVLVTAHRRENHGTRLQQICGAIRRLAAAHPEARFVYPVHPNPNVVAVATAMLSGLANVFLVEPLAYRAFVRLLDMSCLVLTDSGGLQEEAPSLGKPVLVMRDVTERPEGVEAGVNRLVGADPEVIFAAVDELLRDSQRRNAMTSMGNPFGDGVAGVMIADTLKRDLA